MHFCLLIGYGASAVNPYLAIETLEDLRAAGHAARGVTFEKALKNYKKAINKGLLKVFSKMGISTLQSYRGAQIFEAIGLNKRLVDKYFTGTPSRIEGVGLDVLAREAQMKHDSRLPPDYRIRHRTRDRRQLSVPRPRRVSPAESADGQQAAACGAAAELRDLQGIHRSGQRPEHGSSARCAA